MSRCPLSGDATSLRGGTLGDDLFVGADGQIYAVAQGSVIVSGSRRKAMRLPSSRAQRPAGRLPGGAIIEREIPCDLQAVGGLVYQLRNPDFSTAVGMADVINAYLRSPL
jgi:flagellar P-ring protein precursor FlgI